MRNNPLVCPNQALISQLSVLEQSRDMEGEFIRALGYARAIAVSSYQNFMMF